jgi:PAS domain S-box-containing protein
LCTSLSTLEEGRYLDVNDAFIRVTGFERDEVIGKASSDLNLWLSQDQRAELLAGFEEQGRLVDAELGLRMKYGRVRDFLWSAELVGIGSEKFILGSLLDITGRKTAERRLTESHKRLQIVLNSLDTHVYVADLETYEILFMNDQINKTFGQGSRECHAGRCFKIGNRLAMNAPGERS